VNRDDLTKLASKALLKFFKGKTNKALPGFKYVKPARNPGTTAIGDFRNQVTEYLQSPAFKNRAGGSRVDDAKIVSDIFMPKGVNKRKIDITGMTGTKGSTVTPYGPASGVKLQRPLGRFGKDVPSRSTPDWKNAPRADSWRGPQRLETSQLVGNPWGRSSRWSDAVAKFNARRPGRRLQGERNMLQMLSGRHLHRFGKADNAAGNLFLPGRAAHGSGAGKQKNLVGPQGLAESVRHTQPQKGVFFRGTNTLTPDAAPLKPGDKGAFVTRYPSTAASYAMSGKKLRHLDATSGAGKPGSIQAVRPVKGVSRRGESPHFGPRDHKRFMENRQVWADAQKAKHNPKVSGGHVLDGPFYEDVWNVGKNVDPSNLILGNYNLVPSLRGVQPGWTVQRVSGPRAETLFGRGKGREYVQSGQRHVDRSGLDPNKPVFEWQRPPIGLDW